MSVDLEINNYSLEEILNLFKIPIHFNETDLKRAKKKVLQSHPDKSNLDPKYFIFYSKAYKILFFIYEFKHKATQCTDYFIESEEEKRILLDKVTKKFDASSFNEWFNREFEKHHLEENDGYSEWLKSDTTPVDTNVTRENMNEMFENKKKGMVIEYKPVEELDAGSGYSTLKGCRDSFTSSMFSSLPFYDLKTAHTESILPVVETPLKKTSLEEYQRNRIQWTPLSEKQSLEILNENKLKMEEESSHRAYSYAKAQEEIVQKNNNFWSNLKRIK
jgi:curved DNA-binding protein CbpA